MLRATGVEKNFVTGTPLAQEVRADKFLIRLD